MRELKPGCKIFAAEASSAAPLASSLAAGSPQTIEYKPSFVDGIGAKSVFPNMFDRARKVLDGSLKAGLDEIAAALQLVAERNRVISEGAGATPVACALSGKAGSGKIVAIVSGGNIDFEKLCSIVSRSPG
jgi:threonine dehydratase